LHLVDLKPGLSYVIDSAYEVAGNWTPVHSFIATSSEHRWMDPLGKDVTTAFYRIRQAPY
jgi:hypothetical protein